ncbi:MAG: hypothetical protein NVS2B12_40990 [Ktedonobacteraceae bacterium]
MSELSADQAIRRVHIGPLQIGIILLTVITAGIHLYRALLMSVLRGPTPTGGRGPGGPGGAPPAFNIFALLTPLFYLNALGYILLVVALYLPPLGRFHRIIRWLLIAFALVTIVAWFVITGGRYNVQAYIDKPVEILLIALLIIEDRQEARAQRG